MKDRNQIIGVRYGRLIVISYHSKKETFNASRRRMRHYYTLKCDCGNEKVVCQDDFKYGNTKSCGCLKKEAINAHVQKSTKHGQARRKKHHPLYDRWSGMMARCYSPTATKYPDYGGRGIYVTKRWHVFKNYFEDMVNDFECHVEKFGQRNTYIDRIDNNGPYSKKNCRFVDARNSTRNKRSNIVLSYKGSKKIITDWANFIGIDRTTLEGRLKRGWSVERTLSTPISKSYAS